VSGLQQPAHRAAEALVIVNDRDIDGSGDAHYGYRLSPLTGAIYCPLGKVGKVSRRRGIFVATLVNLQVQSGDFLSDEISAGRISYDLLHIPEHNLFLCCDETADDFREQAISLKVLKI
jgi:hypothetical protein